MPPFVAAEELPIREITPVVESAPGIGAEPPCLVDAVRTARPLYPAVQYRVSGGDRCQHVIGIRPGGRTEDEAHGGRQVRKWCHEDSPTPGFQSTARRAGGDGAEQVLTPLTF